MMSNEEAIALFEVFRIKSIALEAIRCLELEEDKNELLRKENRKLRKSLQRLQRELLDCRK